MLLFSTEWVSPEVVGLSIIVLLALTGTVAPDQAFSGFGSQTFLLIFGLLVMSQALLKTGVVDFAAKRLLSLGTSNPSRLLFVVLVSASLLSAVMSNTAATAFFLPIVFALARKLEQDPAQYLLPLAFSSILTSSVTLISTSSNLVLSELLSQNGQKPLGMFELSPVGVPITVVGLAYLWFVGRRLLPKTRPNRTDPESLGRAFHTEVIVPRDSPLVGRTLQETGFGREYDLSISHIMRGSRNVFFRPRPNTLIEAEDVLVVEAQRDQVLAIKDRVGVDLKADVKLPPPGDQDEPAIFAEAVLLPASPLIGRTLEGLRFRERFDIRVLAVDRADERISTKISDEHLRLGDVLLMEGTTGAFERLSDAGIVRLLGVVESPKINYRKAALSGGIFAASLAAGSLDVVPLSLAMLIGTILMFVTRCVVPSEIYRDLEWKVLLLIGSMLGFGAAMTATGADRYLASRIVSLISAYDPLVILSGFFALTLLLTQPMSNQAAVIVVTPVALQTAAQLGLNPRTFAMMIAVAASTSYITPLEPSCMMVYGPGRYRFRDFMRVGIPLTILIYLISLALVPYFWPPR